MTLSIEQRREHRLTTIEKSLARRHRKENGFRRLGLAAVLVGLTLVTILFASILTKGIPAFWQATLYTEIHFDPEVIDLPPAPVREAGETPYAFNERHTQWMTQAGLVNWQSLIDASLERALGEEVEPRQLRDLRALVASGERYALRDRFIADPSLLGDTVTIKMLAGADVDVWVKGNIDRDLPDARQQLSPQSRAWIDVLQDEDVLRQSFSTSLFVNTDSRSSLASAGLAGAFMGSLFMMLVVIALSVPIGVSSAIYLEEFAPKNRLTDLIEININNLAAVPSIVFGLLGASIFIG
ncbi:DUF3333 domain-containing protein, partial [Halomonas sp. 707D7]|uniref:DUF3333 domain-containing protein n=2 Tax=unclassified Halomonas TaxID=2609666 RepID=UPI0020A1615B